ncbi:spectrin beta chain, non-erythrocytic 2-like isoform X2 [Rhinatrema bivittatum]|nr:spectrin beta chain, non-erythrocytic 2-like isoform X2 [Rhinatrema bivittatum]
MGDHWVSKQNPSTDTVRKQIQVMKDQWLLLKPTANGQSGALGGTRNLQEFNKTADLLEAWIREKEETPSLAAVLAESSDRIFLTRRILDLKQEQQRFRSLHQDMNSLAQKLEKQGQGNRKDTSARRKQLNKMWLRVQRTLKEQQETLQLALEAASFFQQADTLLQAMDSKRKIVCGLSIRGDLESCQDQDMRDIASQVMMLDVLLSQLSSIHPSLAASVNLRHQQVRESWVQLQEAVRGDRSALRARQPGFDGGAGDSLTCERAEESQVQSKSASEDREHAPARNVREPGSDALSGGPLRTLTRRKTEAEEAQLHSFCQAAAAVLSCLRENMRLIVRWRETENVENLEEVRREQDAVRQAIWSNQGRMEAVLREGRRLLGMGPPAHAKVERILGDLEELWEDLRKRHQESESALQESEQAQRLLEVLTEAEGGLQVLAGSLSVPVAMQSPELIRSNLQETSALDTELLSRGVTLQVLREQTARIAGAGNSLADQVHRKLEMVEEKYRCVQDSLRRRISDLRDSLVLVEFLQNVQMEESLRPRNGTLARSCRAPQESPCLLSEVEPMSGKLDELQEAVQMLNEAVRERERALAAAREAESLLHLLPNISHRITSAQSLAELLSQDIGHIHREITDMKNKSSPHSLQELQRQQKEIEVQMAGIWRRASVQRDLCPGRAQELEARVQQSPPAREARQWQVLGEQSQLPRTAQLCPSCHLHFSVMSWTQDKEAEIFREERGTDGLPIARRQELDPAIQGNIRQCQELPAAGWKLIGGEPFLTITIKQRLELLRSFLGWVLLYLSSSGNQREKQKVDAVLSSSVASMCEEFQDCCAERAGLQEEEDFLLPQSSDVPQRPAREPGSPLPPAQRPAQDPPGSREALTEQTRGADLSGQASTLEPSEVPVVPTPQPASGSPGEAAGPSLGISKEGPEKRQMEAEEGDQQNPRGAEFLLMEGTLGKKHTLQQGGKKAAGRSWSRYHAVLVRRTLCFYQDRKDSMKSPVLVTSLTLRGAVCSLELDYTKKPHVFRLHLADGSECLLQAPSAALTQEWVSKIQQNAAVSEGDLFQSFVPVPSGRSCLAAGAGGHQSVPEDSREIFRLPPPAAPLQASQGSLEDPGQLKDTFLQRAVGKEQLQSSPTGSPRLKANSCHGKDPALTTRNRRSFSLNTAAQQQVPCVSSPDEATEMRSSSTHSLYARDHCPSSGASQWRARGQTTLPQKQQQERSQEVTPQGRSLKMKRWDRQTARSPERTLCELQQDWGHRIPPSTKNKSVFKMIFQKKD